MKILVLGSINIDYNYYVGHITTPKETQGASHMEVFPGGKGLNQAVTLARAGLEVQLAGQIGSDGQEMLDKLKEQLCIDISPVRVVEGRTGHAIIQVDETGQNCIILYGGANQSITGMQVDETLKYFEKGDIILLQNEINELKYIMEKAYQKGLRIFLNPSPCDEKIMELPLELVDTLLLNEVEGEQITGKKEQVLEALKDKFPEMHIILTLGSKGSVYADKENCVFCEAKKVNAVDTTAAGDTFTGYYIAAVSEGESVKAALELATKAAAVAVTRQGAVPSIPYRKQF